MLRNFTVDIRNDLHSRGSERQGDGLGLRLRAGSQAVPFPGLRLAPLPTHRVVKASWLSFRKRRIAPKASNSGSKSEA